MEPVYFATPGEFRAWLEANHERATELLVGFHKVGSGRSSMTWPESVDQALCFGWIDGVRRRIDDGRYSIRFTPRRRGSVWSAVNIRRLGELAELGAVTPAGERAFAERSEERSRVYAYEQDAEPVLAPEYEARLRADAAAWADFSRRPPGYQRTAIHWIMSARREETRERRLAQLISDSAAGRTIPPLRWASRS